MIQQLSEPTSSRKVRLTVALVLLLVAAGTVFSLQHRAEAKSSPPAVEQKLDDTCCCNGDDE